MKLRHLGLTAGVAAATAVFAAPVLATVYGVAGEALLLPLMMNDRANDGTGEMNTYVQIRVPTTLGSDFVINNFTAPNVTNNGAATPLTQDGDFRIYWSVYDPASKKLQSDSCVVSQGDSVLWTTDEDLLAAQRRAAVTDDGHADFPGGQDGLGPRAVCGQEGLGPVGYVVFETFSGADGAAADFAMEGSAWISDNRIREDDVVSLLSVPMIPMADGEDPVPAHSGTSPRLGLNEVITDVNNASEIGNGVAESPVVVSPLGTGIRMNNGNPGLDVQVDFAGGVQGPMEGNLGINGDDPPQAAYSMHVLWFDRNNEDRSSDGEILVWDEHEFVCDSEAPIDRELNVLVYNMALAFPGQSFGVNPWTVLEGNKNPQSEALTDLVGAMQAAVEGDAYVNDEYCDPFHWNHTIMGYVQYLLEEEGTEFGGAGGSPGVNAAAVAFEAHESLALDDAWARHLMTVRGFQ